MTQSKKPITDMQRAHIAELLKERIYATLALLAVLVSIDTEHYSALKAGYLVAGTIFSLWAASLVATLMSRRIIYSNTLNPQDDNELQLRKHAPILATLPFPMLMIVLAAMNVIPLNVAIYISIGSVILLMIIWSILSAKSLQSNKLPTSILIAAELAIGFAVVGFKVLIEH